MLFCHPTKLGYCRRMLLQFSSYVGAQIDAITVESAAHVLIASFVAYMCQRAGLTLLYVTFCEKYRPRFDLEKWLRRIYPWLLISTKAKLPFYVYFLIAVATVPLAALSLLGIFYRILHRDVTVHSLVVFAVLLSLAVLSTILAIRKFLSIQLESVRIALGQLPSGRDPNPRFPKLYAILYAVFFAILMLTALYQAPLSSIVVVLILLTTRKRNPYRFACILLKKRKRRSKLSTKTVSRYASAGILGYGAIAFYLHQIL